MSTKLLNIPKTMTHGDDLVVMQKKEFLKLVKRAAETSDALQAIREGETAYKRGKTIAVSSLRDLL